MQFSSNLPKIGSISVPSGPPSYDPSFIKG